MIMIYDSYSSIYQFLLINPAPNLCCILLHLTRPKLGLRMTFRFLAKHRSLFAMITGFDSIHLLKGHSLGL